MSTELRATMQDHLKQSIGEQVFDAIVADPESTDYTRHLNVFTKTLTLSSLSFSFHEAKECRRQGNFNNAMLLVSELVRDHITSLRTIQKIFDQIHGDEQRQVVFRKFRQCEPLEVGLDNAPDVLMVIDQFIIPWRQDNQETLTGYLDTEQQIDLEMQKLEVFQRLTSPQVTSAEIKEQQEKSERLLQKLMILRIRLGIAIIDLTKNILKELAEHLDEQERSKYLIRLLEPLVMVILSNVRTKSSDDVYVHQD